MCLLPKRVRTQRRYRGWMTDCVTWARLLPAAWARTFLTCPVLEPQGDWDLAWRLSVVLETLGFEEKLQSADLVFTGEGRIDFQSARGKVVCGVAARAKEAGVPVIALVGEIGPGFEPLYDRGLTAVFSINRVAQPFSESRYHAEENLSLAMENIARMLVMK